MRDPDTLDDISKERFEGTILKSIPRHPPKTIKKELEEKEEATEEEQGAADAGQVQLQKLCGNGNFPEKRKENTQFVVFFQVQIKVEKMEEGEKGEVQGGQEVTLELKKEKTYEEVTKEKPPVAEVKTKSDVEVGRLVMTIDGQQKQLTFGPKDLLTTATMLDGDKVRTLDFLLLCFRPAAFILQINANKVSEFSIYRTFASFEPDPELCLACTGAL